MIDTKNIPTAYAEVLAILDALGDSYKSKIPKEILDNLESMKDKTCKITYDRNDTNPDLSREALALIAWLNMEYWCEDEEEKARLKEAYDRNEKLEKLRQYQRLQQGEE